MANNWQTASSSSQQYFQYPLPVPASYPTSVQSQQPYMLTVPVIPESYPEHIHFQMKDGKIHSFTMEEVLTKLGLKW